MFAHTNKKGKQMSNMIYEASVYSRPVSYRNFLGEEKTQTLYFALDPLQLMQVIAGFTPKKSKSGNPALKDKAEAITDEEQLKMVRDLAIKSAGSPSVDGETWEPFTDFDDSLVGKAFLTKLAASDGDRKEFSEKVILDPFRAFVGYAIADPSNAEKEKQQFRTMLQQMENIFITPEKPNESVDERRARLAAEMAALDSEGPAEGTQGFNGFTPLPPA